MKKSKRSPMSSSSIPSAHQVKTIYRIGMRVLPLSPTPLAVSASLPEIFIYAYGKDHSLNIRTTYVYSVVHYLFGEDLKPSCQYTYNREEFITICKRSNSTENSVSKKEEAMVRFLHICLTALLHNRTELVIIHLSD